MEKTTPMFILGSGRCGTFQMVKLLETLPDIDAHHEYLFENILKPAVLYRMGKLKRDDVLALLSETHVPAVHYSDKPIWLDSSNSLPWLLEPLIELFPQARFIHLVRDGRKVASSFFHKFKEVVYADECVDILSRWVEDPSHNMVPPPEKKYWRPLPVAGEPEYDAFKEYSQFQRISYYWRDCNVLIQKHLAAVPEECKLTIRLEDLVSRKDSFEQFLSMFDVEFDQGLMDVLKRPVNVAIPKNFMLSEEERHEFEEVAGEALKLFGYDDPKEYEVVY